jgi:signal transduction histidine kinase/CBS domain-containing protein
MWHHSPLSPPLLSDLIDPRCLVVSSDTAMTDAIGMMKQVTCLPNLRSAPTSQYLLTNEEPRQACALVMQAGQVVGILTQKDGVKHDMERCQTEVARIKVSEVMTQPVITLTVSTLQQDAATLLCKLDPSQVSHLPVLNTEGQLLGVLHRSTWQAFLDSSHLTDSHCFPAVPLPQVMVRETQVLRSLEKPTRVTSRMRKRQLWRRKHRPVAGDWHPDDQATFIQQVLREITQRIRSVSTLEEILNTIVNEVLNWLQVDRVSVYPFSQAEALLADHLIEIEAMVPGYPSMLGFKTHDPLLMDEFYLQQYRRGEALAIANIQTAGLDPSIVSLLEFFAVKSKLVVPILQGETLWGLLVLHQCASQRQWQPWETDLLKQLFTQLMPLIQQAEFYQQVHQLNVGLEGQVRERTAQLQQALQLESTLKRITDKVRDSLEEQQILPTAVGELAQALAIDRCVAVLYDLQHGTGKVCYEHAQSADSTQGNVEQIADFPIFYAQLRQGQCFQFCEISPYLNRGDKAILACPVFDNQQIFGDLRLYTQRGKGFNELEVRLVQQVANQCAIAIRQARLYQAAQAQVRELERLNQLKDDFLSTVSHELRTPLSSIKMALQVLDLALKQEKKESSTTQPTPSSAHVSASKQAILEPTIPPYSPKNRVDKYLQILREECDREIKLINNVLTLQHLEAGTQLYLPTPIRLQDWLPQILEVFEEQARNRQLTLQLDLPAELPILSSDLFMLDHLLEELLTNACKFTPPGELITISAQVVATPSSENLPAPLPTGQQATLRTQPMATRSPLRSSLDRTARSSLLISVTNTGVELLATERDRVFDKFYRIPNSDPWKQGGTGLGLALVKKLAERLNGRIWVDSEADWARFTVALPID